MRTLLSLILGSLLLSLAGCGGPTKDPGAALGEPCTDGADCESHLCFVETDGMDGKCAEIPAACPDELSCSDACFDEIKAMCTTGGSACIKFIANVTITCATPGS